MKPRVLVLPAAALILAAMTWYRLTQGPAPRSRPETVIAANSGLAPSFEAVTATNKLFRLDRFLGRERVILVFFDGEAGADKDPALKMLREHVERVRREGYVVVGVSTALPQQNRQSGFGERFVLVTDVNPPALAHRQWGCYDADSEKPLRGVFVIDRGGRTPMARSIPVPLEDPVAHLAKLLD